MDRVEELIAAARELGFQRVGVTPAADSGAGPGESGDLELVCALSCWRREPDDLSAPGDPHALIAPFARRHYYREAVRRLGRLADRLAERAGPLREAFHPFSNSRRPEKRLAVAAGLGFYGRNGLVISPGLGSLFVIAGIRLPGRSPPATPLPEWGTPGAMCGDCRACREACPTGALETPGRPDLSRCLQAWAARAGELPDAVREAWGTRLYGCQACQEVCPWNRGLRLESECTLGEVGPSLPLRVLLGGEGEEARRALLRGTAMGLGWVAPEALLRNALLAAGRRGDPAVRPQVERWRRHPSPALAAAAGRALERLG